MKRKIFLVFLAIFISSASFSQCFAAEKNLRSTLENTWKRYLQAGKSGKESEFIKTISSFQLATLKNNLASARRSLTPEVIKSISENADDISTARFVKLMENGPTAALVYVKDEDWKDATGKPRVEFVFMKFVKEESGWKVDGVMTFDSYKYTADGKETAFDASSLKPPFLINGQVPKAPQAISAPNVAGYLEVFSYGYKTQVKINGNEQQSTDNQSSTRLIIGGMRKGTNNIEIHFIQTEKRPNSKPSLKIRRIISGNNLEECFSYEPINKIEGTHTLSFTIKE